jgi:hypothetical protein
MVRRSSGVSTPGAPPSTTAIPMASPASRVGAAPAARALQGGGREGPPTGAGLPGDRRRSPGAAGRGLGHEFPAPEGLPGGRGRELGRSRAPGHLPRPDRLHHRGAVEELRIPEGRGTGAQRPGAVADEGRRRLTCASSTRGSSPWMFTTTWKSPKASRPATSATRSVPEGWSGSVRTHGGPDPPAELHDLRVVRGHHHGVEATRTRRHAPDPLEERAATQGLKGLRREGARSRTGRG